MNITVTFGSGNPTYKRMTSKYDETIQSWVDGLFDVQMGNIIFDKKCNNISLLNKIKEWIITENVFFYNNDIFIDKNYCLNCDGDVKLEISDDKIPEFITFNEVKGEFLLRGGNVTSLRGVPLKVGKRFDCSNNKIQSLEHSPVIIGYDTNVGDYCNFNCSNNELKSLMYSPNVVNGDYFCYKNKLETLEGVQTELNGNLICNNNKLTTIKHAPSIIKGDFNVSNNLLTNIDDCNSIIDGNFICKKNLILR